MNFTEAYDHYMQDVIASARACVDEGGGIWVGTMDCPASRNGKPAYTLVLFNSKKTGSTLALKTIEITPELVREHIRKSDKTFEQEKK